MENIKEPDLQTEAFTDERDAVEWYQSLGQWSELTQRDVPNLVKAAQTLLSRNPEGFYIKKAHDEVPYFTVAACMMIEASRVCQDESMKDTLRAAAIKSLESVRDNPNQFSLESQVDVEMYLTDLMYLEAHEQFAADGDWLKFAKQWRGIHKASLVEFRKFVTDNSTEVTRSDGSKRQKYQGQVGKIFEWYYILGRRHQLLKDEEHERQFIRSAYLREDRGGNRHGNFDESIRRKNFDVALEVHDEDGWHIEQMAQLGLRDKEQTYDKPIKTYSFTFGRAANTGAVMWGMVRSITPLIKEVSSLEDYHVNVDPVEKKVLEEHQELMHSYTES
jgi:hypothetical protein